jgi:hypothetical protein
MTASVTSFPLSKVEGRGLPHLPFLAGLFIYSLGEGVPPPLSGAQGALPCLLCLFFFSCLFIIQFFFFFTIFYPWAGVSLSRGLC